MHGAQELFFLYGIRSVLMDDIAKHLSVSKKTIYRVYKDKEKLVHELVKELLKEDEKVCKELQKGSANVVEEFFNIMKHVEKMICRVNPGMFYDLQKYYPASWKLFIEFKENCILKMVEESLTKGIKQGHIRSDINVKTLSRMRIQQIEMGFNPTVFPPDKFKLADVQTSMIDHFLHGVCTLK